MDLHHINILPEITVMRGWDPKLVNMQSENAPLPILSMPLWRRMGNQREDTNAHSLIFLSEEYWFLWLSSRAIWRNHLQFQRGLAELHLDQLHTSIKCFSRDWRDGGIDDDAYHIVRNSLSSRPGVDEDLAIGSIALDIMMLPNTNQCSCETSSCIGLSVVKELKKIIGSSQDNPPSPKAPPKRAIMVLRRRKLGPDDGIADARTDEKRSEYGQSASIDLASANVPASSSIVTTIPQHPQAFHVTKFVILRLVGCVCWT